jgi:hypothetical protein
MANSLAKGRPILCQCGDCYLCRSREYKRRWNKGEKSIIGLYRAATRQRDTGQRRDIRFRESEIQVDFANDDQFEDISMDKVEAYWARVCD